MPQSISITYIGVIPNKESIKITNRILLTKGSLCCLSTLHKQLSSKRILNMLLERTFVLGNSFWSNTEMIVNFFVWKFGSLTFENIIQFQKR